MKYIVKLKEMLDDTQRVKLKELNTDIIYESKYIPVLGVVSKRPDEIRKLDFVINIREPEIGYYQEGEFLSTITFEPIIKKSLLVNNDFVGWGDTRIAVLDSGVNQKEINPVEIKDFTGTGMFDTINHGNRVAKIIKFFAKASQLYIAKVGNSNPDELNLMLALEWAAEKGVNIVNVSAGFNKTRKNLNGKNHVCTGDCELCDLVNKIVASTNILIVVAAGNKCKKEDSIDCPGNATNVITVGAVDAGLNIADYSSIGKPGGNKPNLVAPGNGYIDGFRFEGTSFSSPLVAGIIGAILNKVGNVTKAIEYIYKTANVLDLPKHHQGNGCLDLEKLVEVVVNEKSVSKSEGQNKSS